MRTPFPFKASPYYLPDAYDLASLGEILGCSAKQLGYYLYKLKTQNQYTVFDVPKRRGGTRSIRAPHTNLKIIQRNIARALAEIRTFKSCVNGFVPGRNIKRNAYPHVGQRYVLNIDLKNFFETINFGRVYGLFSKPPYNFARPVAAALAQAVTVDNLLPQGAPSSPIITNMICAKMDAELARFAKLNYCTYTRYADDMTFSTNRAFMPLASNVHRPDGKAICELSSDLRNIVEDNGFIINEEKIRMSERTNRQEVTGLIVNQRVNVRRGFVREIRAMLHAWRKFGVADAEKDFKEKYNGTANFESAVRGKIIFISQIRGRSDLLFRKLAEQFNVLAAGPKIRLDLLPDEIASQATWVLEYEDKSGNAYQGTAFLLEGYGFVTCAHCVGDGTGLEVYHPSNPAKRISISVNKKHERRDLATLHVPVELQALVPMKVRAGVEMPSGSYVRLLGYPKHHAARPMRNEEGKIARRFSNISVRYIEITPRIIGGNSGGPIVSNQYEVIGIAHKGATATSDDLTPEYLAIDVGELENFHLP